MKTILFIKLYDLWKFYFKIDNILQGNSLQKENFKFCLTWFLKMDYIF